MTDSSDVSKDAIAIVALSGRFPGAADAPALWRNLCAGIVSRTELTEQELRAAGVPDEILRDQHYVRAGYVLDDIARFDAEFFGFSPRQARLTDPQQRIFLECAWNALEEAGGGGAERSVGVFASSTISNYLLTTGVGANIRVIGSPASLDTLVGNDSHYLATQVSYRLNLAGPSVTVHTACSSSLVAVSMAAQSLLDGECDVALAGGITVRVPHRAGYLHREETPYSPDGYCRAFDAQAAGSVFGSGVGVVALKRLEDAVDDRDLIYAVIRGTAVNNDGAKKMAFSAPSVDGQASVVGEALEVADVDPASVDYVETHGTGTALGDPIEIAALTEAFRRRTDRVGYCALGSLKPNIGHLETAAGVVGLIKVALSLHHEAIPPSVNFVDPNPHITFGTGPFFVNTELRRWPRGRRPRRAGLSSFGIGGTNAHVVLEEAPPRRRARDERRPTAVAVSAKTPSALRRAAQRLADRIDVDAPGLSDLAHTTISRQTQHDCRLIVVGDDLSTLTAGLSTFARDDESEHVVSGTVNSSTGRVAMLFSGQGGQWLGMGRGLLGRHPTFDAVIDECSRLMAPWLSCDLRDEFSADPSASRLDRISILQPMTFALQVGLAAVWSELGVRADAVVGHSTGEVAAAHVAGALTLPEAVTLICERARLLQTLAGRGAMAVVACSLAETHTLIAPYAETLSAAVSNSPRATVISGESAAVDALLEQLKARNVFCRRLKSDVAGHSPHVDAIAKELAMVTRSLRPTSAKTPIYSTVTGSTIEGAELGSDYWVRNARELVRFYETAERMVADGITTFVEVGPHPLLRMDIEQCLDGVEAGLYVHSSKRGDDTFASMLMAAGSIYCHGGEVDWEPVCRDGSAVSLPGYPFEGEAHWAQPRDIITPESTSSAPAGEQSEEPLLGARKDSPLATAIFERMLLASNLPSYVANHGVDDNVVYPGGGYAAMIQRAGQRLFPGEAFSVQDFEINRALVVQGVAHRMQVVAQRTGSGQLRVEIFSKPDRASAQWERHAGGMLVRGATSVPDNHHLHGVHENVDPVEEELFYARMEEAGYRLGASFRWIQRGWRDGMAAHAEITRPVSVDDEAAWPGLFDLCFQLTSLVMGMDRLSTLATAKELYIPLGIGSIQVFAERFERAAFASVRLLGDPDSDSVKSNVIVYDTERVPILVAQDVGARRVSRRVFDSSIWPAVHDSVHGVEWVSLSEPGLTSSKAPGGDWLVIAPHRDVARRACEALGSRGLSCRAAPTDGLDQALAGERSNLRGIIHWGAGDGLVDEEPDQGSRALDLTASALRAVQHAARLPVPVPVYLVTQGAQRIREDDDVADVAQSSVWGLGRVAMQEHPDVLGGLIDLDPSVTTIEASGALLDALQRPREAGPHEVGIRGRSVCVPRIVRIPLSSWGTQIPVSADGSYVVTGGLGGLGRAVARRLVERGARDLVLIGRRGPDAGARAFLEELRGAGARVRTVQADVTDAAALEAALESANDVPVRGVIHAAGGPDDGVLLDLDAARVRSAFGGALGAWNLHRALGNTPLDFFVMFSSSASVLGSAGQANYSASGSFIDMLAHHRRARGLPALAINWGPWSETGRAKAIVARRETWTKHGVGGIATMDGLDALEASMLSTLPQLMVLPVRWSRYTSSLSWVAPRLPVVMPTESDPESGKELAASSGDLETRIAGMSLEDAAAVVYEFVEAQVRVVLGLSSSAPLDPTRGFFDMGMDSMGTIELKNRLGRAIGRRFPAAVIFECATPEALGRHLTELIVQPASEFGATEATGPSSHEVATEVANDVDDLSEEELNARLDRALSRIAR